jgi:hypothetical protein
MHFSFGDVHVNMYPSGMSPVPEEAPVDESATANPDAIANARAHANATAQPAPAVVLTLPPIALSELQPPTKAYLLRRAGAGRGPWETMKELLDRGAGRAGFGGGCACACGSTAAKTDTPRKKEGGHSLP